MSTCLPAPETTYEKLKQKSHVLSTKNLNLNENSDCFKTVNFCKRNKSENLKTWKNEVEGEKGESRFANNNDIWNPVKSFKYLKNNEEGEEWKNECFPSSANNSTLSLHITAYENSISDEEERSDVFADITKLKGISKKNFEKKFFQKRWEDVNKRRINGNVTEMNVEIPRGKEIDSKEPEIMQFKASQKLLDPNHLTPGPMQQSCVLPPVTAIKDIDGIDKKLDAPTTPLKPLKKRSSVSLVADLSKCPKINVDDYINKLMTSVDKDGNITDYLTDTAVIEQICVLAIENLSKQPSLLELAPKINIVGDIHGQFFDLLRIFDLCGSPAYTKYLFLGDYVDRGPHSLEVICLLLLLRIRYPETFFLLRGNHECSNINRVYGFLHECEERFQRIPQNETIWGIKAVDLKGTQVWYRFQDVFNWLPLTALIGKKILCMHGGLSPDLVSLDQLRTLVRPIDPESAGIHIDLLWADPDPHLPNGEDDFDWAPSARGISSHFNVKAVNTACARLGLDMIVRGHQVVQDGYEFFGNRKLVTIFSAPNYCGDYNNSGAIMTIDVNLETSFHIIKPLLGAKKKSKDIEVDIDDIDLDELIAGGSAEKC